MKGERLRGKRQRISLIVVLALIFMVWSVGSLITYGATQTKQYIIPKDAIASCMWGGNVKITTVGGSMIGISELDQGENGVLFDGGYAFAGWYKEAACINPWDFETDIVTEDTVLYAKWEDNISECIITSSDLNELNMDEESTIIIDKVQLTSGSGCEAISMESGAVFFGDDWKLSMPEGHTIIGITIITDLSCNASDIVEYSTSKWEASDEDDIATWSGIAQAVDFGAEGNYISEIRIRYENIH